MHFILGRKNMLNHLAKNDFFLEILIWNLISFHFGAIF